MTIATTTIRIDIATLPYHRDRSRPNMVAEVIEDALREGGIKAGCSDLFSHIKIGPADRAASCCKRRARRSAADLRRHHKHPSANRHSDRLR